MCLTVATLLYLVCSVLMMHDTADYTRKVAVCDDGGYPKHNVLVVR